MATAQPKVRSSAPQSHEGWKAKVLAQIGDKDQPLFIGGKWLDSVSGKTFATLNPATGETICQVAEGDKADVDLAVKAARKAFEEGPWPKMSAAERGRLLNKLADLIEKNKEELAALESLDNGKPYSDSLTADLPLTIKCYRYYAGWADKIHGKTIPVEGNYFCYTRHEPVGVVGQIIPWNFPLLMQAWKWGPALATRQHGRPQAGRADAADGPARRRPWPRRPASPTASSTSCPATARPPAPPSAATWTSTRSPSPANTRTGQIIMEAAARSNLKRVSLELGGKSPNVVFADADLDAAVEGAYFGLFFNQGQCCCAGSRLFVEEKIHDQFVEKMREEGEVAEGRRPVRPGHDAGAAGVAGAVRPHHGLHRRRQEGGRQAADRRQARRRPAATSSSRPSSPT